MPIIKNTAVTIQLLMKDQRTGHQMTITGKPEQLKAMINDLAPLQPDSWSAWVQAIMQGDNNE